MTYIDYQRITPEGYIRVVSSADYDSIVSYTQLSDIVVYTDVVVNLPNTVQATFKSGKTETMVIKWERVSVDTSTAGNQKIYGDIGNGAAAVLQNVIVNELSDLDILRQIRDANPTSQLPNLWLDSEDPYTQWEGLTWNLSKTNVTRIDLQRIDNIYTVSNINKLNELQSIIITYSKLQFLDISNLIHLISLSVYSNLIENIILTNNTSLTKLTIDNNKLTSLSTLLYKGSITDYDFKFNNFTPDELDRFRAMGFTDESKLLPQNP